VTAPAPQAASPAVLTSRFLRFAFACICLGAADPALAEAGGNVSVFSDERFRGYSLSAGHPVGALDLSYDDPSGFYLAATGSVVASSSDGIKPFGLQLGGGYARRLSDVTFDLGAIHSEYSHYGRWTTARSYTEVYAGATYRFLSARVAYSPHYFEPGSRALYGELDANFSPAHKVGLTAHAGILVPVDYRESSGRKPVQYDWRLGISRDIGHASLHLIGSGGGPDRDPYNGHLHSRTALVAGISWSL
jgi:uncharacterized protein (TIGR02001 family)